MIKTNTLKTRQIKNRSLIVLLGYLLYMICFSACKKDPEKTTVQSENITESVYASGIIKSKGQYQVFSTVSGLISKLMVKENDLVQTGSPLLMISDQTTRINSDNATLAADYAAVQANRDKLADQENTILLAKAKFKNDSLIYVRQQRLWSEGIGSKIELEQKELAKKNSETLLRSAKLKYNDLVRQLDFNAKQSRNNLAISKSREGDLLIKSKINGKVFSLSKEQGEMVNPQTALAIIGNADSFYIELQVDEYDITKIRTGQLVVISMDSYKGQTFEARVTNIDPLMNERSKSFLVEAVFVKQPPVLYPNLTAEANIIIRTSVKALTIPRNYLIDDSLVILEKDKKIKVVTGLKDYRKVEIISGLSEGSVIYKP